MIHFLDRNWHGYFSRELEPALTIDPGDTVVFTTLDSGWGLEPFAGGPYTPRREIERDGDGHALTGPVAIRGAQPGMALGSGSASSCPGPGAPAWPAAGCRPGTSGSASSATASSTPTRSTPTMTGRSHLGHEVALRPFLGVMGSRRPRPASTRRFRRAPAAATSTAASS